MKKILLMALAVILIAACAVMWFVKSRVMELPPRAVRAGAVPEGARILVACFSRSGHTRALARGIAGDLGADLFEIVPAQAYPEDYDAVVAQARDELDRGYLPPLAGPVPDLKNYDVVFVGSPVWWGGIAPPVKTFLAERDWAGKIVIPFCTHGGGGYDRAGSEVAAGTPGAAALEGFSAWDRLLGLCGGDRTRWLEGLGFRQVR